MTKKHILVGTVIGLALAGGFFIYYKNYWASTAA